MQNPRGDFVSKRRHQARKSGGRDFFNGCEKPGKTGEKPGKTGEKPEETGEKPEETGEDCP